MSRGLNKLQIIGRLGRDPEARYTADGKMVVNFSVATGGRWTDRDGNERDDTEWFRVEAWDRLAETCNNYLHKGDQVYIEGRLKSRKYTDKDGIERTSTDVVANNMLILTPKGGGNTNAYDNNDVEGEETLAAGAPRAAAPARAPEPRAATPANRPAAPTRTPAPAPARPASRNQPQPIESEDDIPF